MKDGQENSDVNGIWRMTVQDEPARTLWMFEYWNSYTYILKQFYAFSEEDVEEQVRAFVEQQGVDRVRRMALTHFPYGFRAQFSELPGKISVAQVSR